MRTPMPKLSERHIKCFCLLELIVHPTKLCVPLIRYEKENYEKCLLHTWTDNVIILCHNHSMYQINK